MLVFPSIEVTIPMLCYKKTGGRRMGIRTPPPVFHYQHFFIDSASAISAVPDLPTVSVLPSVPPLQAKGHKAQYKQRCYHNHACFGGVKQLGGNSHQHCAKEGSSFSKDVKHAEVFACFFFWNNLRIIRPGECLDGTLEDTDAGR